MNESARTACIGREARSVLALGVLVGVSALSLSVIGMLGWLTAASVATCLVLGLLASTLYVRASEGVGMPRAAWLGLPLLLPSTLAALLPPHTWDEVAYGAALPRDFARAGRLFYNADYGAYAAFPASYEALVAAGLLVTGDCRLTQLLNVVLALAMAQVAVLLARALGVTKPGSLVAGLFVLCAPALIDTTPLTKNDVASAFFQVLAVLALVSGVEQRGHLAIVLSGGFLGASLGVKYSSLHFTLAFAPFAVLFLARSAPSRADAWKRAFLWVASLALVGSPWYVRNLALFSNPVFPFANDWLGVRNGFTRQHSDLLRECFDGLADFSLRTGTLATFVKRVGRGFGVVPMSLLLVGAWPALRGGQRSVGVLLVGSAFGYLGLTLLAGFWEPRYFLSLLVLSSAIASLGLQNLGITGDPQRGRPFSPWRLALIAVVGIALWGGYPTWREQATKVRAFRSEGREAFLESRVPYYGVARWLNAHMGDQDRVAIGFNIQPFFYLERPYYHIHPLTQGELVSAQTPEEVEAVLRQIGATYLAFSGSDGTYFEDTAPKISAYRERLWLAQRRLRQAGKLRLVTTIAGVRILRLESFATPATHRPMPIERAQH